MNKPVVTLAVTILSAVACGATFLFALAGNSRGGNYSKHRHRRATVLVEFNVGDLIEGKTEARKQSWQRR